MSTSPPAIVLLSGGLDSYTSAAIARDLGFGLHALTVRYGQTHDAEVEAARRVAASLDVVEHVVIDLDLRAIARSALTGAGQVPKDREIDSGQIPATYVPARNTIFLSLALAWAESAGAGDVFLGINALDYSGYPDCRPAFVRAFERLAALATKAGVEGNSLRIHAPLLEMTKADIVRKGRALGLDYALTMSCYDPTPAGRPCGHCDSCLLRARGFAEAGVADPLLTEPAS